MISDRGRQGQSKTSTPRPAIRSVLSHLKGLLSSDSDPLEDELIDYVIKTVEPKLKQVRGYRKRLQKPLQICREHCKAIVTEIPGPIHLNKSGYYEDPVIKAAFAGSERIEDVLVRAKGAPSQTSLLGTKRVALLTMTSTEKTLFMRKKQGEMVVGDVAMRAITFTDHNVVGLTTTLGASIEELERFCLEIIVEAVARELSEMRTRLVDLRERQERLRAMNKMFGGTKGMGMGSIFVPFDPEKQDKQKKLEQMLLETETEIAAARCKNENPEEWFSIIENFLSKPGDVLSMRLVSLRLDWRNVLTNDPDEEANVITLATFTIANEMQREGVLVTYEQT